MPCSPEQLLAALVDSQRVLLTGPVQTDGDSLGACLALQRVLRDRGVEAVVTGAAGYRYDWMPGADAIVGDDDLGDWPAVVVLDGDRHRLCPGALAAFESASVRAIIDHHGSTRDDGYTHYWVEAETSSTCEMLWSLFRRLGIDIDADLAACLYTGLVFDTGAFRYSNTTPTTHGMAADLIATGMDHTSICLSVLMDRRLAGLRLAGRIYSSAVAELGGAVMVGHCTTEARETYATVDGDVEGIVESLLHIHGVEVSVLVVERGPHDVKLSLRSRGRVDVAEVARAIHPTGGGHRKAAGVSLDTTALEAQAKALEVLESRL